MRTLRCFNCLYFRQQTFVFLVFCGRITRSYQIPSIFIVNPSESDKIWNYFGTRYSECMVKSVRLCHTCSPYLISTLEFVPTFYKMIMCELEPTSLKVKNTQSRTVWTTTKLWWNRNEVNWQFPILHQTNCWLLLWPELDSPWDNRSFWSHVVSLMTWLIIINVACANITGGQVKYANESKNTSNWLTIQL